MHKERSKRADVAQAVIFEGGPFPCQPRLGPQGVRGRTHSEQIDHHQFAVVVPLVRQEADLRRPSMGQQCGVFREPGPVHAVENCMCQFDDVAILKVLAAGEDAAEQYCGVDRRDFGVPDSFAGIDVGEVIEESAMRRQLPPKKYERRDDAQARVLVGDVAALFCDADCGQAKTGGGDACDHAGVVDAHVAAVFDQSGLRIGLLPEEEETAAFKIVQKLIILRRKGGRRRERCWFLTPRVSSVARGPVPKREEPSMERTAERERRRPSGAAAGAGKCCFSMLICTFIHAHSGHPNSPRKLIQGDTMLLNNRCTDAPCKSGLPGQHVLQVARPIVIGVA